MFRYVKDREEIHKEEAMGGQLGQEDKSGKTEMEALFIERYLEHGNASQAHVEAGFKSPSSGARRAVASRLFKKLQPELMKLRAQRGLTWDTMGKEIQSSLKARQQRLPND